MAIEISRFKARSFVTSQEIVDEVLSAFDSLNDADRAVVLEWLASQDNEHRGQYKELITQHHFDRPLVPIADWIKDPYYVGEAGLSLYDPWKRDLIEIFEANLYDRAILIGSLGS